MNKKLGFKIIAAIAKSQSQLKNNKLSFICNIVYYYENLDLNNIYIESIIKTTKKEYNRIIINIYNDLFESYNYTKKMCDDYEIINIGICHLLIFAELKNSFINEIFNSKTQNIKPIFIFNEMSWSVVRLIFSLYNIELSGGSNNYKHKLTTLHFDLITFLLNITSGDIQKIEWILKENMKKIEETKPFIERNIWNNIKNDQFWSRKISYEKNNVDKHSIIENEKFARSNNHDSIIHIIKTINENVQESIKIIKYFIDLVNEKLKSENKLNDLKLDLNLFKDNMEKVSKIRENIKDIEIYLNRIQIVEIALKDDLNCSNEINKLINDIYNYVNNQDTNKAIYYIFKNRELINKHKPYNNIDKIVKNILNKDIIFKNLDNYNSKIKGYITNHISKIKTSKREFHTSAFEVKSYSLVNTREGLLRIPLRRRKRGHLLNLNNNLNTISSKSYENENENTKGLGIIKIQNNVEDNNQQNIYNNLEEDTIPRYALYMENKDLDKNIEESKTIISSESSNKKLNYLDVIKDLIDNIEDKDRFNIQVLIESSWVDNLKNSLSDINLLKGKKLNYILHFTSETVKFLKSKKLFVKYNNIFKDLENIDYILIAFVTIITYVSRSNYTNICEYVGKNIFYNSYKKKKDIARENFFKNNPLLSSEEIFQIKYKNYRSEEYYVNYKTFLENNNIKNTDLLKIGTLYLMSFEVCDILYKSYDPKLNNNKLAIVKIKEEYLEILRNNVFILPNQLPMICKPMLHNDKEHGGYLENKEREIDIITGSINFNKHKVKSRESLYNIINYLNSIEFEINKDLLHYLSNEGKYLLNNDYDTSTSIHIKYCLKIAETFKKIKFYLPTNADWRGRIYVQSFFLNYQGSDLASSLINFHKGEKLNDIGKNYLYLYGANLYNYNNISKESFNKRIAWIEKNYTKIISLDQDFILKAENKFKFAAFCLVLKQIFKDPNTVVSIPIFLDATCSGIQHVAAILQDFDLGNQVNLIEQSYEDKVNDIYSYILTPINNKIRKFGLESNELEYKSLKNINLNRNIIKTSIMTKVYNATIIGITEQLINKVKIEKISEKTYYIFPGINGDIMLNRRGVFKMAKIIYDEIFIVFPSLKSIFDYFLNISKIYLALNIPIYWITPVGLHITQHYLKPEKKEIKFTLASKSRTMVISDYSKNITNNIKQVQAIIPNIVHSLDAAHLMKIINNILNNKSYQDNFPVIFIHDCFGTIPNKIYTLENLVKKEFIELYTKQDFLKTFHDRLLQSLKDHNIEIKYLDSRPYIEIKKNKKNIKYFIPSIPKTGNLNLNSIIYSKYFIT